MQERGQSTPPKVTSGGLPHHPSHLSPGLLQWSYPHSSNFQSCLHKAASLLSLPSDSPNTDIRCHSSSAQNLPVPIQLGTKSRLLALPWHLPSLVSHHCPTPAFLLFLEYAEFTPTSVPLHLLFLQLWMLFPQ